MDGALATGDFDDHGLSMTGGKREVGLPEVKLVQVDDELRCNLDLSSKSPLTIVLV